MMEDEEAYELLKKLMGARDDRVSDLTERIEEAKRAIYQRVPDWRVIEILNGVDND